MFYYFIYLFFDYWNLLFKMTIKIINKILPSFSMQFLNCYEMNDCLSSCGVRMLDCKCGVYICKSPLIWQLQSSELSVVEVTMGVQCTVAKCSMYVCMLFATVANHWSIWKIWGFGNGKPQPNKKIMYYKSETTKNYK